MSALVLETRDAVEPSLACNYHSGKDIHFAVDPRGNVRTYNPTYSQGRKSIGNPVGFLEFRDAGTGYFSFRAVHIATGQCGGWEDVKLKALCWLGDRVREDRYGVKTR